MQHHDIVVVGCGLSASLLLLHLYEEAMEKEVDPPKVLIVSDTDFLSAKDWAGTYCTWTDELEGSWLHKLSNMGDNIYEKTWTKAFIKDTEGSEHLIDKRYSLIDKLHIAKIVANVIQKCVSKGVWKYVKAKVFHFVENEDNCVLFLEGKQSGIVNYIMKDTSVTQYSVSASFVINCSGHFSQDVFLSERILETKLEDYTLTNRKFQSFVGEKLYLPKHGLDTGRCCLMDWSVNFKEDAAEAQRVKAPHSFGYLLVHDENTIFIEETIVLCDQIVSYSVLQKRLETRKKLLCEQVGASYENLKVLFKEKYALPLGGQFPLVSKFRRIHFFGGAGNFGHPASGYMFSFVVKEVPEVSKALFKAVKDKVALNYQYKTNIIVQHHLNDLGANLINSMENSSEGIDFLGKMMISTFKSPYWFEFMTRDEDFWIGQYLYNMVRLAVHLNSVTKQFEITRFVSIFLWRKLVKYIQGSWCWK